MLNIQQMQHVKLLCAVHSMYDGYDFAVTLHVDMS